VLGSWNVKKGVLLTPFHEGTELVWSGSITVPKGFECEYTYYVVDDNKNIVRWEMGKKHELKLPEGVQSGQEVEFRDLWQVASFLSFHIYLSLLRFM
jgi:4-alpha-glucanotransferase